MPTLQQTAVRHQPNRIRRDLSSNIINNNNINNNNNIMIRYNNNIIINNSVIGALAVPQFIMMMNNSEDENNINNNNINNNNNNFSSNPQQETPAILLLSNPPNNNNIINNNNYIINNNNNKTLKKTIILSEQRRHSLKYTRHIQLPEMRQPDWINTKFKGTKPSTGNNYKMNNNNIGEALSSGFFGGPGNRMDAHMDLWYTDRDPTNNYYMNNYNLLKSFNRMTGRISHHEAAGVMRISKESEVDLVMDKRFKGVPRNAIANLYFEPQWNKMIYPFIGGSNGVSSKWPKEMGEEGGSPLTLSSYGSTKFEEYRRDIFNNDENNNNNNNNNVKVLNYAGYSLSRPRVGVGSNRLTPLRDYNDTYNIMNIKTKEETEAYWERLLHLINIYRPAVGDLEDGEHESRSTRHVHQFFVTFQDAISSNEFQDSYLLQHFHSTRPKELEDLFGIFLEMESNYVNEDYCPRCSLPLGTTRFCGEGDAGTPFRRNRGRYAPHQQWGKEWYDVVIRRAEQLWYRAKEDPFFGTSRHTQKQVEELLNVYVKTKNRGKAIAFITSLRGSSEFINKEVTITPKMQEVYDKLLDETPHPHLLTNGHKVQPKASKYLLSTVNTRSQQQVQANSILPLSPAQFRIDLEISKFRREQKEEGAIRLPPKEWKVDMTTIIPYKINPNTGKISNWRDVKAGIEKSFLSTGLPDAAYNAHEIREMRFLSYYLFHKDMKMAGYKSSLEVDKVSMGVREGRAMVFPDKDYYRVFDITPEAVGKFCVLEGFGGKKDQGVVNNNNNKMLTKLNHGDSFIASQKVFSDPSAVQVIDPNTHTQLSLNTTSELCQQFGYTSGQILLVTPAPEDVNNNNKKNSGYSSRPSIFPSPHSLATNAQKLQPDSTKGEDLGEKGGKKSNNTATGKSSSLAAGYIKCVVLGVNTIGHASGHALLAQVLVNTTDPSRPGGVSGGAVFELGTDIIDVHRKFPIIITTSNTITTSTNPRDTAQREKQQQEKEKELNTFSVVKSSSSLKGPSVMVPPLLELEESKYRIESGLKGVVIGIRDSQLYVQWYERGVAEPMGTPEMVASLWSVRLIGGRHDGSKDVLANININNNDTIPSSIGGNKPSSILTSKTTSITTPVVISKLIKEPFSWETPFRNDWSEDRLEEIKKAPWTKERYVSLIENKFTPKVKRFGYTQHITQDDFVTKEYANRLRSRQYFANPQAFEVIPDKVEKSVRFAGKNEGSLILSGLPGVDRNELENGWQKVDEISDREMGEIEQCLRDISGKRPGNYIKDPSETSKNLDINEKWWTPLKFGWQQHNREQGYVNSAHRQDIIEGSKTMFGGNLPAFGTTHGIVERIRDVMNDYQKGFGLGPNGHGPDADQGFFNTLGGASRNSKLLGYNNILVRLFTEKMRKANMNVESQVLQWAREHRVNPKNMILAVSEWMKGGRAPSGALTFILATHLKEEIAAYNEGIPDGAGRINLSNSVSSGHVHNTNRGTMDIFADVSSSEYKNEFFNELRFGEESSGSGDGLAPGLVAATGAQGSQSASIGGFISQRVINKLLGNSSIATGTSSSTDSSALVQHCAQQVITDLHSDLLNAVGVGIPAEVIAIKQQARRGNTQRRGLPQSHPNQLIKCGEISKVLTKYGLANQVKDEIISNLMSHTDAEMIKGGDVIIPLDSVLTWKGPEMKVSSSPIAGKQNNNNNNTAVQESGSRVLNDTIKSLLKENEGRAMDVIYITNKCKANPILKHEFMSVVKGLSFLQGPNNNSVSATDSDSGKGIVNNNNINNNNNSTVNNDDDTNTTAALRLYDLYCDGLWTPSFEESTAMWVNFLRRACIINHNTKGSSSSSYSSQTSLLVTDNNKNPKDVVQLDTYDGMFEFENVKMDIAAMKEEFQKYGIVIPSDLGVQLPREILLPPTAEIRDAIVKGLGRGGILDDNNNNNKTTKTENTTSETNKSSSSPPHSFDAKLAENIKRIPNDTMSFLYQRFFQRSLPLIPFYHKLKTVELQGISHTSHIATQAATKILGDILDNEGNSELEREFQQNAERYWKKIIDGRRGLLSDLSSSSSSGGRGGGAGGSRRNNNNNNNTYSSNTGGGSFTPRGGHSHDRVSSALGNSPSSQQSSQSSVSSHSTVSSSGSDVNTRGRGGYMGRGGNNNNNNNRQQQGTYQRMTGGSSVRGRGRGGFDRGRGR